MRCGAFLRGEAFEKFPPGRITVLEFWATWCGPCIGAFPNLSELQSEYRERGKHRELAVQLSPPEIHERINTWLDRLEEQALAAKK